VGGAVMTGYRAAIADGAAVIVKVDGDGQMDRSLIPAFVAPILAGEADYTKGNRFFDLEQIGSMPPMRLFGNAVLSLMTKLSSGYWDLFDPTNGYTAIHADAARHLPFHKISKRYFFETDMLFRLNTLRAAVVGRADGRGLRRRGQQPENLEDRHRVHGQARAQFLQAPVLQLLPAQHVAGLDRTAAGRAGRRLLLFGAGSFTAGTVMLSTGLMGVQRPWPTTWPRRPAPSCCAALPVLMGVQLILAFLAYDIASVPRRGKYWIFK
jgi:dolichol-phosphate mannosyltransferase